MEGSACARERAWDIVLGMAESGGNLGTTMFSGHKHTNRSLPVNNKICNQRWVDRCQQLHRMRLNQIKPAIGASTWVPPQRGNSRCISAMLVARVPEQTTSRRRATSTCSKT